MIGLFLSVIKAFEGVYKFKLKDFDATRCFPLLFISRLICCITKKLLTFMWKYQKRRTEYQVLRLRFFLLTFQALWKSIWIVHKLWKGKGKKEKIFSPWFLDHKRQVDFKRKSVCLKRCLKKSFVMFLNDFLSSILKRVFCIFDFYF